LSPPYIRPYPFSPSDTEIGGNLKVDELNESWGGMSPVELPIFVVLKFPYGQVNILLDSIPLYQERNVQMDTNIPLNLTK
jgi:hypothetical protein